MFGEISSQLTCGKLKLLKQSLLAFSRTNLVPSSPYLPLCRTPTWSPSFSFDSSLPLALILHYYSSLSLSLTLFLCCYPLRTLSPGCFPTLCKPLSTHSLSAVLSIYLLFVSWTCHRLAPRDRFRGSCDSKSEHLSYYFRDRVALSGSEVSRLACLCSVSHGVPVQLQRRPLNTQTHLYPQGVAFSESVGIVLWYWSCISSMTWLKNQRFSMLQVQPEELNLRGLVSH